MGRGLRQVRGARSLNFLDLAPLRSPVHLLHLHT